MKRKTILLLIIILSACLNIFANCYSSEQDSSFGSTAYAQDSGKSNKRALNEFKKIMATIKNPQTRKKLKEFVKNGFEKSISIASEMTPDTLIKTAKKYLGVTHKFGGESKSGMDCSGLIKLSFAEHGIKLPHSSEEQARYGYIIADRNQLKKGDLIFFIDTYTTPKLITHVGIYLGNNKMIHTSSKRGVSISETDNTYWKPRYIFGTRLFGHIEGYELASDENSGDNNAINENLFVLNNQEEKNETNENNVIEEPNEEPNEEPEYNEPENEEDKNIITNDITKEFAIEGSSDKNEKDDEKEKEKNIKTTQNESKALLEKYETLLAKAQDNATHKKFEEFIKGGIEKEFSLDKVGVDKFVNTVFSYKGVKYKASGSSRRGLDASGLIVVSLAYYDITIPHSSQEIARYGKIIKNRKDMKKGDLIFFTKTYNTPNLVSHMGVYLGNDQMIHTSSSRGVTISSVNSSYWRPKFIFGTRIFKSNQ